MAKWIATRPADKCLLLAPPNSSKLIPASFIRPLSRMGFYFPFLRSFLIRQQLSSLRPDLVITELGSRLTPKINQLIWICQPLLPTASTQALQQISAAKKIIFTSVLLLDQYKKQQYPLPGNVSIVPPVLAPVYEMQSLRTPSLYIKIVGQIPGEVALINLLKAYSLFKRRQQSELQLIFSQEVATLFPAFISKLNSYKYKSTVVINPVYTAEQDAYQEAGAYALLTLDTMDQLDFHYRKASQLQIPLLALPEKEAEGRTPVEQLAEPQQSLFLLIDNQTAFNQFLEVAECC